jgi:uncharacterized membrane protein YciS (DUF1049 family)
VSWGKGAIFGWVISGLVWLKLMVDVLVLVMALSMYFGESRFITEV